MGGLILPGRRQAVALTLALLIGAGAIMPLVFFTGNRTADSIGKVEGIQQDAVAPHQQAATIAFAVSLVAAVMAGASAIVLRRRGDLPLLFRLVLAAMAIASAMAIAWTAMQGGAIRHPEAFYSAADVGAGVPLFTSCTSSVTLDVPIAFPLASVRG